MKRSGFSLVEILLSAMVLAVLGLTIQGMMSSTLRGVRVDRLTEAKRHVVLDLLELYCHPNSPLSTDFPPPSSEPDHLPVQGSPVAGEAKHLTVAEALEKLNVPEDHRADLQQILEVGKVAGFNLTWTRRIRDGAGSASNTIRLDVLEIATEVLPGHRGPILRSFRIFTQRN